MSIKVNDVIAKLQRVDSEIESILKTVGGEYCDEVEYDYENPEERFLYNELYFIVDNLEKVREKISYLSKPIVAQGFLAHNDLKRYELPNGKYLASGSVCELLVTEMDGQRWVYTLIEHNGDDYYSTALGKDVSINGMMARVR